MIIKVPRGLITAIAHNHHMTKVAAVFLHLKAINADQSGRILDFKTLAVKTKIAAELHMSVKSLYSYIDALENINLATRCANGMLQLASFEALKQHCGALPIPGMYAVQYNGKQKFLYTLKALYWRESEDRQRHTIRKKAQIWMERPISKEKDLQAAIDWQAKALASCFEEARKPDHAEHLFDPDTALSTTTAAKQLGCYWHTSGSYWQIKLERLGLVSVERNRYVAGKTTSYSSPLSPNGVFWSNERKTRLAQMPNLVRMIHPEMPSKS